MRFLCAHLCVGLPTLAGIAERVVGAPDFHVHDPCGEGQGVCWCLGSKAKEDCVTLWLMKFVFALSNV